jgi:hypothetical protein
MAMKELMPNFDHKESGYLFLHALNPYGFKYGQRVTKENIDLNRHFLLKRDSLPKNDRYHKVDSFLNPKEPVHLGLLDKVKFYYNAIKNIIGLGKRQVRQAILSGQYEWTQGVSFGGKNELPVVGTLTDMLRNQSQGYQKVFIIDLHTGYGERGKLHFFGPSLKESDSSYKALKYIFKNHHVDLGSDEDFYEVSGDITPYLMDRLPNPLVVAMTFEYGTLDSQTTAGSLDSLHRTIIENQGRHWGHTDEQTKQKAGLLYRELFFPSASSWQEKVIADSRDLFPTILKRFTDYAP